MTPEEKLKKIADMAFDTTNGDTPHEDVERIFMILREIATTVELSGNQDLALSLNWLANRGISALYQIRDYNFEVRKLALLEEI